MSSSSRRGRSAGSHPVLFFHLPGNTRGTADPGWQGTRLGVDIETLSGWT